MSLLATAQALLGGLDWTEVGPAELPPLKSPGVRLSTLHRALAAAQRPVILVNDAARLAPRGQPEVLAELWEAHGQPTLLVATGTHSQDPAACRDRLRGLPVEVHDADEVTAHVDLGGGARIDRRVARADLILSWGSVEPHYFAGWTGAHKTASIGVLDRGSIAANHAHALSPSSRPMALEGNPVFEGIAEVLARLEEDRRILAVNQVLDAGGSPLSAAVGTWRGSLERALDTARRRFARSMEPVDVLVSCVEPPLSRSLYQADKGIKNTEAAVRDGGELLLVAELGQGVGPDRFLQLLREAPDHATALERAEAGYVLGDHKAVRWRALEARGVTVRVVSPHLAPEAVDGAGVTVHGTLEEALGAVTAASGRGLVVHDAGVVVCEAAAPAGSG